MEVAEVKDTLDMLLVRLQGVGKNQDIIKIDETKWKITKDFVHHPLESLGSFPEAKGKKLEEAKGSLGNISGSLGR